MLGLDCKQSRDEVKCTRASVMAHALIPALRRLRQEDHSEFQVSLSYRVVVLVCNSQHVKVEAGGFQVPSRLGFYRQTLSKNKQTH